MLWECIIWFIILIAASRFGSAEELAGNRLKNGGNYFKQNYSALTAINRENVGQLKAVWRARLDGSGVGARYSGSAQPVVHDGVLYLITGADDVFALSLKTGQALWKYRANLDGKISTACCGWTSRGVGFGDGTVFVGQLDGRLVALDRNTGKTVWSIQAERWQEGHTITAAPLYYDGMVIVGFAGGENGARGRVTAFEAKDGHSLWTFYTIPGPGEPGHETWPRDSDAWKYGGATVWQTPAVDPELSLRHNPPLIPNQCGRGKIIARDHDHEDEDDDSASPGVPFWIGSRKSTAGTCDRPGY